MNALPRTPPLPASRLAGLAALGLVAGLSAQGLGFATPEEEDDSPVQLPGMEMLVDGSILEKVLIPRYDDQDRLISTLRADKLVLIDKNHIDATTARIRFYHEDETPRGSIDLASAELENADILRSGEPVTIRSDDFEAHGTGLVFQLRKSRGLLLGPATATFMMPEKSKETSMNRRTPLLSAAGALMLVTAPVPAQTEDARLSPEEIEGMNRLAVSAEPEMEAKEGAAAAGIEEAEVQLTGADKSLKTFLAKASVDLPEGSTPDLQKTVPAPDPQPFAKPAKVTAKDGIFVDSQKGVMVLLKDVTFDHPDFKLQGADEVKVFFPDKPQNGNGGAKKDDLKIDFGKPSKVVAVGTLVLEKKATGEDNRQGKASGRQMIYDVDNDTFIIRGGQPWAITQGFSGRVTDPDGYIIFNIKTGDASAVGTTETLLEGENLKRKQ
ncbi:hypothetical protein [Haloferula sargassicola]|uniref:Organic solvent tolerance-like N-terminal domain-containing protein n=1 Tax=Haloferula sargassicola TaxID=490096 RepID=A0ABP9USY0_9BACT